MSEAKRTSSRAYDLSRKLQDSLAQKRWRPWLVIMVLLLLAMLFMLFLAWSLYPQPRPAILQVLALDAVFTTEEVPQARVQLLLPPGEEDLGQLNGKTVVIQEQRSDAKSHEIAVQTDEEGHASISCHPPPAARRLEFLARYINLAEKQGSLADQGELFIWPGTAPLFLLDADETLDGELVAERAGKKLQQASQQGWHIVYVALVHAEASPFRLQRANLKRQVQLPPGPVLGRAAYPGRMTVSQERHALLQSLRQRFKGPILIVVKNAEAAQDYQAQGIHVQRLSSGAVSAGGVEALSWNELQLPTP